MGKRKGTVSKAFRNAHAAESTRTRGNANPELAKAMHEKARSSATTPEDGLDRYSRTRAAVTQREIGHSAVGNVLEDEPFIWEQDADEEFCPRCGAYLPECQCTDEELAAFESER